LRSFLIFEVYLSTMIYKVCNFLILMRIQCPCANVHGFWSHLFVIFWDAKILFCIKCWEFVEALERLIVLQNPKSFKYCFKWHTSKQLFLVKWVEITFFGRLLYTLDWLLGSTNGTIFFLNSPLNPHYQTLLFDKLNDSLILVVCHSHMSG
jgi:hypothetical protein